VAGVQGHGTGAEQIGEFAALVQHLSLARSAREIQAIVRTGARRLTGADGAAFVVRDGDECHYVDEDMVTPMWNGRRLRLRECVSGWAILNRRAAIVPDVATDARINPDLYAPTSVKSLVVVPIRTVDPIGAIENYWTDPHDPTTAEVETLRALADTTAVAMQNLRAYQDLDDARLETLQCLARAAEYRDDDTYEHTERVGNSAARIAQALGLAPRAVELVRLAAPLHDIGKLAISDTILLKPGKLTPDEFETIKTHAAAGAELLANTSYDVLRQGHDIALTHHEWWNGSGYPNAIAGDEIQLSGRIVAVADVFDALTHQRPYKHAWPVPDAVDEIHRLRDQQFDPQIVDAFTTLDHDQLANPLSA